MQFFISFFDTHQRKSDYVFAFLRTLGKASEHGGVSIKILQARLVSLSVSADPEFKFSFQIKHSSCSGHVLKVLAMMSNTKSDINRAIYLL